MPPKTLLSALSFGAFTTFAQLIVRFLNRGTRANVDITRWTPELLKQLERRRFEELCAAYFETLGFRADVALSGAGGGVDINLFAQGAERASMVLQCQPWNAYRVGIKPVRGLVGSMAAANVAEGVLVTSGKFTKEAHDFAGKQKISLIDGADLLAKLAALLPEQALGLLRFATQGDFLTPTCPTCAVKMIPRKSTTHGRKYWGCRNYPGCKHTSFSSM
jgi:restriction system protein